MQFPENYSCSKFDLLWAPCKVNALLYAKKEIIAPMDRCSQNIRNAICTKPGIPKQIRLERMEHGFPSYRKLACQSYFRMKIAVRNTIRLCGVIVFIAMCNVSAQEAPETRYFRFHSNYWLNLHHFLYQKAEGGQLRKLQEDGLAFPNIGEAKAWNNLSRSDRSVLEEAIDFYKQNLIDKTLRRDLGKVRLWLKIQPENGTLIDTTHSLSLASILNSVSPIYKEHFWKLHDRSNKRIIDRHLTTIGGIESTVIPKMEALSANKWPSTVIVRVDICAYANWAGAYTSTRPEMNIVISSLDPLNEGSYFVETVLHEGTHLLYKYGDSPVRERIFDMAEELKMDFPSNLWHAVLFYLCGKATQDELKKSGIDHKMIMDVKKIFSRYNTSAFRNTLTNYYNREIDLDRTIFELLNTLKK